MFVDLGHELAASLEIIDPALARCCHLLYGGKFDSLSLLSNSIEWDCTGPVAKIKAKQSLGKLAEVDLEDLSSKTESALAAGVKMYWPTSALDDFADDFEEVSIGFEDDQAAAQLENMIIRQNTRLKEAKEKLRSLIKDSFSIEEILFQPESHSYR
jgi:hypothetical protein